MPRERQPIAARRGMHQRLDEFANRRKKAHATLDLLDVLNFPSSQCAATNAHWIKVYPPNQFSATYVRWTAMVCSKPTTVYLFVAPVRSGG